VTSWNRTAGDGGPDIVVRLDGVEDLDAVTAVEGRVSLRGGAAVILPGTVTDPELRYVQLDVAGWLPDADEGPWHLKTVAEFTGEADPVSWPAAGFDRVHVGRQL
jgi:hypothetical protein